MAPTLDTEKMTSDMNALKRRRDRSQGRNRRENGPYQRYDSRAKDANTAPNARYSKYPRRSNDSSNDWNNKESPQRKSLRSSRRYIPKTDPCPPPPPTKVIKNWADINESSNDDELWELLKLGPSQGPVTRSKTPVKQMEKPIVSTPTAAAKSEDEFLYQQFKSDVPLAEVDCNQSVFKTPSTSRGPRQRGRQMAGSAGSLPASGGNQREIRSRNYFSSPVSTRSNASSRNSNHSNKSGSSRFSRENAKTAEEMETDMEVLKRRQKQIDFGKNTIGYQNYITLTPKAKRVRGDPATPNKFVKFSRRSWDMQVKNWRKKLHSYDPSGAFDGDFENVEDVDVSDILSDLSFDCSAGCSSPVQSSSCMDENLGISTSEIGDLELDNLIHNQMASSDLGPMDSDAPSSSAPIEYHFGLTEMEEADFLN